MTDQIKPLFTWRSAICESELGSTTRHVALTLALYMNERGGSAHPGPARLARETGLNVSTVKEKLRELEKLGWLRCVERGGLAGETRRANEYEAATPPVMLPLLHRVPQTPGAEDHPSSSPPAPGAQGDPITPESSPRGGRKRRGTPIPDQFKLKPEDWDWASENCPQVDARMSTKQFVTFWRSDGRFKVNWTQAWRNWLLKDQEHASGGNGRSATRTYL